MKCDHGVTPKKWQDYVTVCMRLLPWCMVSGLVGFMQNPLAMEWWVQQILHPLSIDIVAQYTYHPQRTDLGTISKVAINLLTLTKGTSQKFPSIFSHWLKGSSKKFPSIFSHWLRDRLKSFHWSSHTDRVTVSKVSIDLLTLLSITPCMAHLTMLCHLHHNFLIS